MANQTPAKRGARETHQFEDLGLGLGVSAFRPGQTLRRSDFLPHSLQPTVGQNEDDSNPDLTERGLPEEEQSEVNNQTSADSEVVRRLEAELAQERVKCLALERASAGTFINDALAVDRHILEPKGVVGWRPGFPSSLHHLMSWWSFP